MHANLAQRGRREPMGRPERGATWGGQVKYLRRRSVVPLVLSEGQPCDRHWGIAEPTKRESSRRIVWTPSNPCRRPLGRTALQSTTTSRIDLDDGPTLERH